jgi:hypothetical protein
MAVVLLIRAGSLRSERRSQGLPSTRVRSAPPAASNGPTLPTPQERPKATRTGL